MEFAYDDIIGLRRPAHDGDAFSRRHPKMAQLNRAKIFAPFDALDGYGENIEGKNTVYTDKITLDESEQEELNRRLSVLHHLTYNSRTAKINRVTVTVRHYVPCTDEFSFSRGIRGQYEDATGVVRKVDMENQKIMINRAAISFDDILSIAAKDERVFQFQREAFSSCGPPDQAARSAEEKNGGIN